MKKIALLVIAAFLLYVPAAHGAGNLTHTVSGCMGLSGKSKGKLSHFASGNTPTKQPCGAMGVSAQISLDAFPECAQDQTLRFDVMSQGYVCSTPVTAQFAHVDAFGMLLNASPGITVDKPPMTTGLYCFAITSSFNTASVELANIGMSTARLSRVYVPANQAGCGMGSGQALAVYITTLADTTANSEFYLTLN